MPYLKYVDIDLPLGKFLSHIPTHGALFSLYYIRETELWMILY
jgi:hypothetical protein